MCIKRPLITIAVLALTLPASTGHAGGVVTVSDETHLLATLAGCGTVTLKGTIVACSPAGGNCSGAIDDGGGNVIYPDASCPAQCRP
jgi:hypothetical protein